MARDRLGVKPLFYAVLDDGLLLFGSELKSLLVHGGLRREVDPLAIEEYFALGYVAEPRTIFRQAKKLSPGHLLTWRRGETEPEPRPYWDVNFTLGNPIGVEEACEELRTRLRESVRLRLISEVPLGLFCPAAWTAVPSSPRWQACLGTRCAPARSRSTIPSSTRPPSRRPCRSISHRPPRRDGQERRLRSHRHARPSL